MGDHGSGKLTQPASVGADDTETTDGSPTNDPGIAPRLRERPTHRSCSGAGSATAPSATDMRRFLALLAAWHGGPVHVVLSVGGTDADICWAQRWDAVISGVPVPHVEIRYEVRGITSAAPIGHER